MSSKAPISLCAHAYLEYYRSKFTKYVWAYDYAEELTRTSPLKSLCLILDILFLCKSEEEIVYVSSGLLEELLHKHINIVGENLIHHLNEQPLMQKAMRYVWVPDDSQLQSEMLKVIRKTREKNFVSCFTEIKGDTRAVDE